MSKVYPPREFPNVPSHEEALVLRHKELEQHMSKLLRSMMLWSFNIGLAMFFSLMILLSGSFKMTLDGQHVKATVLGVLAALGCVLVLVPLICTAWVFMRWR